MDAFFDIELQDCPYCGGVGCLEEEGGWCVYVQCPYCSSRTAEFDYRGEEERLEAAQKAALTWNLGKIIYPTPGD